MKFETAFVVFVFSAISSTVVAYLGVKGLVKNRILDSGKQLSTVEAQTKIRETAHVIADLFVCSFVGLVSMIVLRFTVRTRSVLEYAYKLAVDVWCYLALIVWFLYFVGTLLEFFTGYVLKGSGLNWDHKDTNGLMISSFLSVVAHILITPLNARDKLAGGLLFLYIGVGALRYISYSLSPFNDYFNGAWLGIRSISGPLASCLMHVSFFFFFFFPFFQKCHIIQ